MITVFVDGDKELAARFLNKPQFKVVFKRISAAPKAPPKPTPVVANEPRPKGINKDGTPRKPRTMNRALVARYEQIRELKASGVSVVDIAERFGVTGAAIYNIIRR